MQLHVLGKSPSWPDAGGACSGYLVEHDGFTLLLECGGGVFAKLRSLRDYRTVDAILISHLHADHILDLVAFSYALTLSPHRPQNPTRPPLHAPPTARAALASLGRVWGSPELIGGAFEVREYAPEDPLTIGPFDVRLREVPHYTRAFACDLAAGGTRLTFGSDCGPNDALVDLATGADLLLVEATLTQPDTDDPAGHMTARQAGELGRRAGVSRLMVTHFSDELDPDWIAAEASAGFGAKVILAEHGAEITL